MRKSFVLALITLIPLSASADQFSILSDSYIATSRRALRTPSSKPPADCTISGATPHRSMAQGGMNPETETEKLRADSRAYLR